MRGENEEDEESVDVEKLGEERWEAKGGRSKEAIEEREGEEEETADNSRIRSPSHDSDTSNHTLEDRDLYEPKKCQLLLLVSSRRWGGRAPSPPNAANSFETAFPSSDSRMNRQPYRRWVSLPSLQHERRLELKLLLGARIAWALEVPALIQRRRKVRRRAEKKEEEEELLLLLAWELLGEEEEIPQLKLRGCGSSDERVV